MTSEHTPAPETDMPEGGLAALLRVLDVASAEPVALDDTYAELGASTAPTEEVRFRGESVKTPFDDRIYGGQALAQALLAAGRTVPPGHVPHSMHAYFLRQGTRSKPIEFEVENLRDGRSFSARRVHALQDDKPILAAEASFQLDQPGYDQQRPMPDNVPPPQLQVPASVFVDEIDHPAAKWWGSDAAFEIRPVNPPIYLAADPVPVDRQMVWVKARGTVPPPSDPAVSEQLWHRALLAFACDQLLLEPSVRGAGKSWFDVGRGIPMASLDHAMWWHRDFRVDEWLLFVQEAASSQGGRTLGQARVYKQDGALVASIAQEGMMRL